MTTILSSAPAQGDSSATAQTQADAWMRDSALAQAKGSTPDHIAARQRVARLFCEIHLPADAPDARAAHLASIDDSAPVANINGRTVDLQNPKAKGFLGLGRKPAYIVSERFPPQKPEDPIYALEYFPVKR
jgi:hypothetical protein